MTDKNYGLWARLTMSSEQFKDAVAEHAIRVAEEHLLQKAALEIKAKLEHDQAIEDAEQDRIKAHILSKDAWFEVIDYRGDLTDVANYRWNQSFIDRVSVEHGWHGLGPKEIFKRFLADRDYQNRLSIIQEERDKHTDSPEPWFEWTVKGISDEGYPVHMEWNPAFISHLREQGFVGRNEDEVVKLWLSRMIRFTPQGEMHE